MSSFNLPRINILFAAAIISLLSACGGGGGSGSGGSGFTASNNTNTKPQTSSVASVAASSAQSSQSKASSIPSSASNSNTSRATIDTTAPTMTTSVEVEFTEYDIAVFSWGAATDNLGVTAYKIYRNQIQIDQIDATDLIYVDFNVAPDSTYVYGVSAGDAVGNWSPIKTTLAKTQAQPIPPSSASSSSVSSSSSSISLASTSSSSSPSSTSSSRSSSNSVDSTPPSTPSSAYEINTSATQVDIGWTAATDNIGVTAYRVYRDNILIGTLGASTLEYSDKTANPSKTYIYGIEAGDAAGNWSLARKTVSITTPASTNGDVTLYWAPPTQREDGSSITNAELGGFLIRYKSQTDTDYTYLDISDSSAKSRIITNLSGSYVFQIAVYDSNNLYSSFVSLSPH